MGVQQIPLPGPPRTRSGLMRGRIGGGELATARTKSKPKTTTYDASDITVTCRRKVKLANGRELSALEIQTEYLDKTTRFLERRGMDEASKQLGGGGRQA